MLVVVENHFIHKDKKKGKQKEASHLMVHYGVPGINLGKLTARKQCDKVNFSPPFATKGDIELYVEETHKDAPNPGMIRVGYIRTAVEWEWSKEVDYNGKLTLKGSYFTDKDKQPGAKIHLEFDGHGPEPTTVNVQVGGN